MTETKKQRECEYCHDGNNSVEVVSYRDNCTHEFECSWYALLMFDAYPGDFHVGADVYVSSQGLILMETGEAMDNDYLPIRFCPVCGRKLGDLNE